MRRTIVRLAFSLVLCGTLCGTGSEAEVSALQILNKSFDPLTRQISYELWNSSAEVITAWRLSLARSDAHGHAQTSVLDQDFATSRDREGRSLAADLSARREGGPLAPGESLESSWRLEIGDELPGRTALSLEVVAVVFEDLSHEGNGEAAEAILEARAARVEQLGGLLGALEGQRRRTRSRPEWSAALRQRAQALRRQGEAASGSADLRPEVAAQLSTTQLELAEWLHAAAAEIDLAVDTEETLDRLTTALRDEYELGSRATRSDSTAGAGGAQKGGR